MYLFNLNIYQCYCYTWKFINYLLVTSYKYYVIKNVYEYILKSYCKEFINLMLIIIIIYLIFVIVFN